MEESKRQMYSICFSKFQIFCEIASPRFGLGGNEEAENLTGGGLLLEVPDSLTSYGGILIEVPRRLRSYLIHFYQQVLLSQSTAMFRFVSFILSS